MDTEQQIIDIIRHRKPRLVLDILHGLSPEEIVSIRTHLGTVEFQHGQILIPRRYASYPLASQLFFSILLWSGDLDDQNSLDLSGYRWLLAGFPRGLDRLHESCLDISCGNLVYLHELLSPIPKGTPGKLTGGNIKISTKSLEAIVNRCNHLGKINRFNELSR